MEAFETLAAEMPDVRLIVAGANHPQTPGYVESVAENVKDNPRIEFTGYVAEDDIPELFRRASVLVLPYSSATGASGVAHLACEFGVPIISAGIDDFREMARDEGLAVDFYETGSADSLASQLQQLLGDPERMREMSEQNFSAALRMTMPQIIRQYLRSFDLQQRARALEPISRFRRHSVVGSFALGHFPRGRAEVAAMDIKAILIVGGAAPDAAAEPVPGKPWAAYRSPTSMCLVCPCCSTCCTGCGASAFAM